MHTRILEVIDRHAGYGVSFVELQNEIEGFRGGPFAIANHTYSSWIYWAGLTQEAVSALQHLRMTEQITFVPASPLVYLIDGERLTLPLVRQVRAYKEDHWAPVTLARPEVLRKLKAAPAHAARGATA
jgi:hypothetical protein